MQLNLSHTVFVACLAITLAACTPLPTRMSLYPDGADSGVSRFWPDLPEVPRYRYAGQLTGEQNFGPEERSRPGAGERFLRWIVGLGSGYREMPRILVRPQSGTVDTAPGIRYKDAARSVPRSAENSDFIVMFHTQFPNHPLPASHETDAESTKRPCCEQKLLANCGEIRYARAAG